MLAMGAKKILSAVFASMYIAEQGQQKSANSQKAQVLLKIRQVSQLIWLAVRAAARYDDKQKWWQR